MGDGEPFATMQSLVWTRRPSPANSLAGMGPQVTDPAHQWGKLDPQDYGYTGGHCQNLRAIMNASFLIVKFW